MGKKNEAKTGGLIINHINPLKAEDYPIKVGAEPGGGSLLLSEQFRVKRIFDEFEGWLNDIQKNSPEWQRFKKREGVE